MIVVGVKILDSEVTAVGKSLLEKHAVIDRVFDFSLAH